MDPKTALNYLYNMSRKAAVDAVSHDNAKECVKVLMKAIDPDKIEQKEESDAPKPQSTKG